MELKIPPLRERPEDIPLLAEFFLQRITRKNGMARIRLSEEATAVLQTHRWPGNVRELENTIARACALASSNVLLPADIPLSSAPGMSLSDKQALLDQLISHAPDDQSPLQWANHLIANHVLEQSNGDIKQAATTLKLTQTELRRILSD